MSLRDRQEMTDKKFELKKLFNRSLAPRLVISTNLIINANTVSVIYNNSMLAINGDTFHAEIDKECLSLTTLATSSQYEDICTHSVLQSDVYSVSKFNNLSL